MMWVILYLTIVFFEIVIKILTFPFRVIGWLFRETDKQTVRQPAKQSRKQPKKQPKKHIPYSYDEMFFYDELF